MRGLTEGFAELLADPALFDLFKTAPGFVADRLDLADDARAAFLSIPPAAVERQLRCLLDKRAHEARILIPSSAVLLGPRYAALFCEYAAGAWPEGHRRHWLDAVGFLRFLHRRGEPFDSAETSRTAFFLAERRLRVGFVRRYPTRFGFRLAIQVLWRRQSRVCEMAFHLA